VDQFAPFQIESGSFNHSDASQFVALRAIYHSPAQMACNVPRQMDATYKTLWTRLKQNAKARQAGLTKLWYDKPRKQFYLLVTLEIEVAEPTPESHQQLHGGNALQGRGGA
jgi:hypothetical protein